MTNVTYVIWYKVQETIYLFLGCNVCYVHQPRGIILYHICGRESWMYTEIINSKDVELNVNAACDLISISAFAMVLMILRYRLLSACSISANTFLWINDSLCLLLWSLSTSTCTTCWWRRLTGNWDNLYFTSIPSVPGCALLNDWITTLNLWNDFLEWDKTDQKLPVICLYV